MTNSNHNGKQPPPRGKKKKKAKVNFGRLFTVLIAIFVFFSLVTALVTYKVVSAYMADIPEFDPGVLIPPATSFIYDKDGNEVTPLLGEVNRIIIPLDEMPQHLIDAFIAIEDERFFDHSGFDARGFLRGVYKQLSNRQFGAQGGSTITQQLAKNAFLTGEKTIKRKVQELYLSYKLETTFTKEEILEFYLNLIFFDYNAYGVEAAAQTYFGKNASEVTVAQAAILAGIPNLPAKYSPYRNMEEAKKRQALILSRMVELGFISEEEASKARNEEIKLAGPPVRSYPFPHFIEYVIHGQVFKILGTIPGYEDSLYKGGLKIYTTLDQNIQQVAEEAINNPANYPRTVVNEGHPVQPQAAVVVADPKSGYVKAIVGGRDYNKDNQDNRAVRAARQAGSVLKPIVVYAPAFEEGLAVPGTVLDDSPGIWPGNPTWYPENYDRVFRGLVTTRYALIHSLNLPAVRLLDTMGVDKGIEYAEKMGISTFVHHEAGKTKHDHVLPIVLGGLTNGLKVIDAVQAFSVLANQGVRTDLCTVLKIEDRNGKVIYEHKPHSEAVLSPETAFLTTSILQDVVRVGTASRLKINRPVAAKTGTSDHARDGWLATYTPDIVAVMWIGYDYNDGEIREPWKITPNFLNPILIAAHEGLPARDFPRPGSISGAISICSKSGLRPGPHCPPEHIISDFFPLNQIPNEICGIHIEVEICSESGLLATEYCPKDSVIKKVFYNRPEYIATDSNWRGALNRVPADARQRPPTDSCTIHTARPAAPLDLSAEYRPGGYIQLRWNAGDNQATGYLVYRKDPDKEDYQKLTPGLVYSLSFTDDVAEPGAYSYQVYAVSEEGIRSSPATVNLTVGNGTNPPEQDSGQTNPGGRSKPNQGRKKD